MEDRLRKAAGSAVVACYTDLMGLLELWWRETEAELGLGDRIGGHADVSETAVMLSLHPDLARSDLAESVFQAKLPDDLLARVIRDGIGSVAPNGILGDARGATATLGTRLIETVAGQVAGVFRSE